MVRLLYKTYKRWWLLFIFRSSCQIVGWTDLTFIKYIPILVWQKCISVFNFVRLNPKFLEKQKVMGKTRQAKHIPLRIIYVFKIRKRCTRLVFISLKIKCKIKYFSGLKLCFVFFIITTCGENAFIDHELRQWKISRPYMFLFDMDYKLIIAVVPFVFFPFLLDQP